MLIDCPYCGPRDLVEFAVKGSFARGAFRRAISTIRRPAPASSRRFISAKISAGPHREYWLHAAGCGSWLVIERDTRTHRILKAEAARQREAQS